MKRIALPRTFDLGCTACPRLARFLAQVRAVHPDYHARPVPPFGDERAGLLVVGLAPGMHGANRTGRPFTGDYAGILLYRTLYKFGFASHEGSDSPGDGLRLTGCRVTNAVKCLPPQNKPEPAEVRRCNGFLAAEFAAVQPRAVLALGGVAHRALLMALGLRAREYPFSHRAAYDLPRGTSARKGARLYSSYHCSRYNTQTKRLSAAMFEAVFSDIQAYLLSCR
ncbi:MAG: SPO1 DNA polymerase [Betaproteobacteria bacterium RBG_16_64_18]|nr:MAG: SPO1 DNA polymerase [Betaproteobacteria bacterium RBG_16_64_18]OGA10795.1 MAG: SPO1 DNA polymerase [Betaproteobacteria bacterium RIFCSPLOWO2_02_FULL_65_20]OGA37995.1 MAG: SPO1 DNA polymerase [Betaproteobacteria bacterium RIFCSPLOWO2_12_FULL_65_110]